MDILLVEDEESIGEVLQSYLNNEGWNVHISRNGVEALKKIQTLKFDFIILDLMLPGMTGEDVCRNIREFSQVPIIMVTSKASERDAIKGLNLGADDYITKPYRMKELVARIHAVMRRTQSTSAAGTELRDVITLDRGRLRIDFDAKEVQVDGKEVNLTVTEFKILSILVKKPGKLFTRFDLSYEVQGYRFIGDGRVMDAHIKNIRKKIEPDPRTPAYIVTKVGAGYKFCCRPDGEEP